MKFKKVFLFIFLALLVFLIVLFLGIDKSKSIVQKSEDCFVEDELNIPDGHQCYFFGEEENRKGMIIKTDFDYNDFLLSYLPSELIVNKYKEFLTDWKEIKDVKNRFSFRIPKEASNGGFKDNYYVIVIPLNNVEGQEIIKIEAIENNSIKMSDLFPKGCFERSLELNGKNFDRFDCKNKLNIGNDRTELFLQEKDYYLHIEFSKTGSSLLDSYIEALILSLKIS